MEQGQHQSAIGADAVKFGVVNDERYETLVVEAHGFGERHNESTCTDASCGRCGRSTAGPNFENRERAGEVYDGQGQRKDGLRGVESYNPAVSKGGTDAVAELEACRERDPGTTDEWSRMMSEPPGGVRVHGGGGSSRIKVEKNSKPTCENCHLQACAEDCPCRNPLKRCATCIEAGRRGGYRKRSALKSKMVSGRISRRAKDALVASGESIGDLLEGIAEIMIKTGLSWEQIAAQLGMNPADAQQNAA